MYQHLKRKDKRTLLLLFAGLLVLAAGCVQIDLAPNLLKDRVECLSLKTNGDTKVSVSSSGGAITWQTGDLIAILTTSSTKTCPVDVTNNKVEVQLAGGETRQGYAVYPAASVSSLTTSSVSITYPSSYDITGDLSSEKVPIPMVAVNASGNTILDFKQIGGILRIKAAVPANTKYVAVTTTGSNMCGIATVTNPGAADATSSISIGTNTATFTVHASGLGSAQDVVLNLPVPCGTYSSLTLKAKNSSNLEIASYSDNTSRTIGHAQGQIITLGVSAPHLFSVSATTKVVIAHGNLEVYKKNNATKYRIHSNDYDRDFVEFTSYNNTVECNTSTMPRDLFKWSEIVNDNTSDSPKMFNVNDGNGQVWRALTNNEWIFLLNMRAGDRYAKARIQTGSNQYVTGLILFPDGYTHPSGLTAIASVNTANAGYSANTFSLADWTAMANAGAVFLPCAGYSNGSVTGENKGHYLSCTECTDAAMYHLYFTSSGLFHSEMLNKSTYYCSVRPVRDYTE